MEIKNGIYEVGSEMTIDWQQVRIQAVKSTLYGHQYMTKNQM